MKSKQLLITSAYPSSEKLEKVLERSVAALTNDFDILLATHYPVSKKIQENVKYYIYDHRNDAVKMTTATHVWADYPTFYCKIHPNNKIHHGYAVYRSMMNAVSLISDYYDDFIYVEGDCIFAKEDIYKLKQFPVICNYENKDALFFKFPDFVSSLIFYSKMDFFKQAFPLLKTPEEYDEECKRIMSYGVLENFMYMSAKSRNMLDLMYMVENSEFADYFNNSSLGLTTVTGGEVVFSGAEHKELPYSAHVAKVENQPNQLAFCYFTNNARTFPAPADVFIDDEKIITLPAEKCGIAVPINPKNENFVLKINDRIVAKYSKNDLLSPANESFIRLK